MHPIIPSAATLAFIAANADGDVRKLALQGGRHQDVDMPFALDQIAGRQAARRKLPSWSAIDGVVYPPRLSMEQCSGEAAATYKALVARRLCGGGTMADLTGGFGVDFAFMARHFAKATYVERQEHLCAIACHNMPLLGLGGAEIVCADGADYLHGMDSRDLIYIDPARRNASGGRTYAIADCTPNVAELRPLLTSKGRWVMVKLSPMLDWRKAVADMGGQVSELHIVAVGGECKELLLVMGQESATTLHVHCVNDGHDFCFTHGHDTGGEARPPLFAPPPGADVLQALPGMWLHEPHAALMKAGCFGEICRRTGVEQVGDDSHLFVSAQPVGGFPGRSFRIVAATTMGKRALRQALRGIDRANIAVRNFPVGADSIRRQLKLADGGHCYIFATTLANAIHALLICEKPFTP